MRRHDVQIDVGFPCPPGVLPPSKPVAICFYVIFLYLNDLLIFKVHKAQIRFEKDEFLCLVR